MPKVTLADGTTIDGGAETPANGQPIHPVSWPGVTTWNGEHEPGAEGATDRNTGGGAVGGERRMNADGTTAGGGKGRGGMRGDNGGGRGNRPGTDGNGRTRNTGDRGGAKGTTEIGGATPDKQQPHRDSGMMFLTGMLCGVAVLSVAAFVVLFLMYRQRRHFDGRIIGIPLLQRYLNHF